MIGAFLGISVPPLVGRVEGQRTDWTHSGLRFTLGRMSDHPSKLFLNGESREGRGSKPILQTNPATEETWWSWSTTTR